MLVRVNAPFQITVAHTHKKRQEQPKRSVLCSRYQLAQRSVRGVEEEKEKKTRGKSELLQAADNETEDEAAAARAVAVVHTLSIRHSTDVLLAMFYSSRCNF